MKEYTIEDLKEEGFKEYPKQIGGNCFTVDIELLLLNKIVELTNRVQELEDER